MSRTSTIVLRAVALPVAALLALTATAPGVARADTAPPEPTTPATVSADVLPTTQINGVAWSQVVVGNTVYVGGSFTGARPAGAALGASTTPRANLLAYDITTGLLLSSWAPSTNAEVLSITASPDGSLIYIGGSFTQVNGQIRNRIAALDAKTGALVAGFQPKPDATVRAVVATDSTVYFGGLVTSVNGVARNRLAAARVTDGALLSWAPNAQGGLVRALALSPSPQGTRVLVGGQFTSLNGSSNPGYGLGAVHPETGASLPWAANSTIRNGGAQAGITSLTASGDSVYATGYVFGTGGNLEGAARMSLDGSQVWVEDCHGDTYGSFPMGDALYTSSHAHYCGNLPDGFPETNPRSFHWTNAFSKAVTGVLAADPLGYPSWAGTPSPSLLKWGVAMTSGTYTGQSQASWTVTGNDSYVAYGGEFPTVGGVPQQGLVRFAKRAIAPNKVGPVLTGSRQNPGVTSQERGAARVAWQANWDRDNEELTYQVIRDGNITAPVHQTKQRSSEWNRPMMGFVDTGLTPGVTYRYRIFVKDPLGNEVRSDTVSVVASSGTTKSAYAQKVLADGAVSFWRLGEDTGTTAYDSAGFGDAAVSAGVTRGAAGALSADADKASTFNGTATGLVASKPFEKPPTTFSTEAWFKTTSTSGGMILGFGTSPSGDSRVSDRQVFLTNTGLLTFGVNPGTMRTVAGAKAYNDGQWHHVVATLGAGGMNLYADGVKVAGRTDTTTAQTQSGHWRIGGDRITGVPSVPTSKYLNGSIDEVAVYHRALTATEAADHFASSSAAAPEPDPDPAPVNAAPTASFTSTTSDLQASFDGSASSDADGTVQSYAWDFGDGTSGTGARTTRSYAAAGTYQVRLTVTDNAGATASTTKAVTVTAAPAPDPDPAPAGPAAVDAFTRTVTDGWGSADTGGAWTRFGTASLFSVAGGTGQMRLAAPGAGPRMTLTGVSSPSADASVAVKLDKVANGGGVFVSVGARVVGGTDAYRAKVKVASNGALTLYLVKFVGNVETTLSSVVLPSSMNYAVGQTLNVRVQAVGASPTTLRARVWKSGATEPTTWDRSVTDSSTPLQAPGGASLVTYLSGSSTNHPIVVSFDNFRLDTVG